MRFKLGMAQILVEGGSPEENLKRARDAIREAASSGCKIVVLPECLDLGWTHPSAYQLAKPIPGAYSEVLAEEARNSSIYVAAGLTERAGDRIHNAAILIDPDGKIILKHRKINVLGIAQDLYSIGDRLGVVETPLGTIGITICADNFPDSLAFAHSLARMGCNLLLSPSAWAVDANHDNEKEPYGGTWKKSYRALSGLFDLTTVGVSCVGWMTGGAWKGRKCIGSSLAVGPGGEIIAEGPYGVDAEGLIVVEVEPRRFEGRGTDISRVLRERGYQVEGFLSGDGYYRISE